MDTSRDEANCFQAEHFDGTTCKVEKSGVDIRRAMGFDLTDRHLVKLVGAPTNSKIRLELKHDWTEEEVADGEEVPRGLLVTIENEKYYDTPAEVVVFLDGLKDRPAVYVKLIMFRDNPELKGIAGHMISIMANAAKELPGATRLKLWAAGGLLWEDLAPGERWGGYAAWPKYGFDCVIPSPTKILIPHFRYFPPGLSGCQHVSDVLSLRGGKEFWRVAGEGSYMNFALRSGSNSWIVLDKFLNEWRSKS